MGQILVGTASWSDPGYIADWYPKGLPPAERLPWYAQHLEMVEVNSSFYGIPEPDTVRNWAEQTPDHFIFNIKLHRLLSRHSTAPNLLPPDLRPLAKIVRGKVSLTPQLERAVAQRLLANTAPLAEAEKLGVFLLQVTPAFDPKTYRLEQFDPLVEVFAGQKLAIELRNRNWVEEPQLQQTMQYMQSRQLILVLLDPPQAFDFRLMPTLDFRTHPQVGYFRAHGRDPHAYLTGRTVAERFDYDYSASELEEIAQRAVRVADPLKELHLVFNNNRGAYAPSAAVRMRRLLAEKYQPVHSRT